MGHRRSVPGALIHAHGLSPSLYFSIASEFVDDNGPGEEREE
jgi:hypothetical protein